MMINQVNKTEIPYIKNLNSFLCVLACGPALERSGVGGGVVAAVMRVGAVSVAARACVMNQCFVQYRVQQAIGSHHPNKG